MISIAPLSAFKTPSESAKNVRAEVFCAMTPRPYVATYLIFKSGITAKLHTVETKAE